MTKKDAVVIGVLNVKKNYAKIGSNMNFMLNITEFMINIVVQVMLKIIISVM